MKENIKSNTKDKLEGNIKTNLKGNLEITPKRDIVFKRIFGAKGNEGILKDFLESILDIEIESLELDLSTEMLPEFYDVKKSRIDVRVRFLDGTEVNVEMQMDVSKYDEKRCMYYWSKIYSNTLEEKEEYAQLRKTICIWILNGRKYNEFKDFHSKWKMMDCKYKKEGDFGDIEIHVIELKKLRETGIMKPTKKEFWLWFIDHTNEELVKMASISNEKIEKAREELEKIRGDKELMHRILLQELAERDEITALAKAEEKGIEKGKLEKAKETARLMLKKGMKIELIEEVTGLSREEIEELEQ